MPFRYVSQVDNMDHAVVTAAIGVLQNKPKWSIAEPMILNIAEYLDTHFATDTDYKFEISNYYRFLGHVERLYQVLRAAVTADEKEEAIRTLHVGFIVAFDGEDV